MANDRPRSKGYGNGIPGLAPGLRHRVHALAAFSKEWGSLLTLSNHRCCGLLFGAHAVGISWIVWCMTGIQRDRRNNAQPCGGNCTTNSLALPLSLRSHKSRRLCSFPTRPNSFQEYFASLASDPRLNAAT